MRPISLNSWQPKRWKDVHGQTMGYRPCIDSYEEMYGAWGERREVLAWGAGTQIVMRIKTTGAHASALWELDLQAGPDPDQAWAFDSFKHVNCWFTYKIPQSFEGRDDIETYQGTAATPKDYRFRGPHFWYCFRPTNMVEPKSRG